MKKTAVSATHARNNHYYLMRHGESLANRRGLIVSAPENAINDFGLTMKGAEQVTQAALSTRLGRDTLIVSSDYKRAVETAEIMKSVIDCEHPVELNPSLRERNFGKWELREHSNYETVWQHDLTHPNTPQNCVETVHQTLSRTIKVIEALEQRHTDKVILLVGHGDVLQILLAHHHNIDPRFHRSLTSIGNADIRSLSRLDLISKNSA